MYDIVVVTSDSDDLVFNESFLMKRRGTIGVADWLAPADYYLPQSEPGRAATSATLSIERRAVPGFALKNSPVTFVLVPAHTMFCSWL